MYDEYVFMEESVPSKVLPHQVHRTLAGHEQLIIDANQKLLDIADSLNNDKLRRYLVLSLAEFGFVWEDPRKLIIIQMYINKAILARGHPRDYPRFKFVQDKLLEVSRLLYIPYLKALRRDLIRAMNHMDFLSSKTGNGPDLATQIRDRNILEERVNIINQLLEEALWF